MGNFFDILRILMQFIGDTFQDKQKKMCEPNQIPIKPTRSFQTKLKDMQKKYFDFNFCFANISASTHRFFKIPVSTPHNWGYVMRVNTKLVKIRCLVAEK